jgi:hypothetical protein
LAADLAPLAAGVRARLTALADSPGGYRDELQELERRLKATLVILGASDKTN